METSIGKKVIIKIDLLISFWTIYSRHEKYLIFAPEYRCNLNDKFDGIYIGGNLGGSAFKVSKWDHYDFYQF